MENIYRDYFNATEVPTGCEAISKQFDYEELIGFAKQYASVVNGNSVLGDVSESFNEELRGKFFKECTHTRDDKGRTASLIRKIDVAPHDLFEWFKSNVI